MHAINVKKGGKPYVFKVKEFNELILELANLPRLICAGWRLGFIIAK